MNLMNHLTPEQLEKREYNKTKRQVDVRSPRSPTSSLVQGS